MSSPVEVCNQSLALLGEINQQECLANFTRESCSTNGQHACLDFYDEAKRLMLAFTDWPSSRQVKSLTLASGYPLLSDAWTYRYVRPAECVVLRKLVDTQGKAYPFLEMTESGATGRYIYSNLEDAIAVYGFNVNEADYNVGMGLLHSYRLAELVAMTVVGNEKKAWLMTQRVERYVKLFAETLAGSEIYVPEGSLMTDTF